MSGSLNKVMLIGNLGDDIKMHHFEDGGCIGRFPIATNENYTNKQTGEKVMNTEWHNIVVWRKLAEIAENYLRKGSQIYLEGKLRTRSWDDPQGNKRYTTEVVADTFTMLGRREENQSVQGGGNLSSQPNQQPLQEGANTAPDDEDDLPF